MRDVRCNERMLVRGVRGCIVNGRHRVFGVRSGDVYGFDRQPKS
jgi:hypothetical protein